jgi:hypothetical protein
MKYLSSVLVVVASAAVAGLSVASAGTKATPAPFSALETQTPKRSCFFEYDDEDGRYRVCDWLSTDRFKGTLRLPIALGDDWRSLPEDTPFAIELGDELYFEGTFADAVYTPGRPTATFPLAWDEEDEERVTVRAKVTWTKNLATITISGPDAVLLPYGPDEAGPIDESTEMYVTFGDLDMAYDVRLVGSAKARTVRDSDGEPYEVYAVKLRATGTVSEDF